MLINPIMPWFQMRGRVSSLPESYSDYYTQEDRLKGMAEAFQRQTEWLELVLERVNELSEEVSGGGGGGTTPVDPGDGGGTAPTPIDVDFNVPRGLGTFTITGEYIGLDNLSLSGRSTTDVQWQYRKINGRANAPATGLENIIYDIEEDGRTISYVWVPEMASVTNQYGVDGGETWSEYIAGGLYIPVFTTSAPTREWDRPISVYWNGKIRRGRKVLTFTFPSSDAFDPVNPTIQLGNSSFGSVNCEMVSVNYDKFSVFSAANDSMEFDEGISILYRLENGIVWVEPLMTTVVKDRIQQNGLDVNFISIVNLSVELALGQ